MEFTFNLTIEKVNLVLKGLAELPAKESYGLINEFYKGVEEQQSKAAPKDKEG